MTPLKFNQDLNRGFNIRRFALITAACLLVAYGIFNSRSLLLGPQIEVWQPTTLETEVSEQTLVVKGQVKNMTYLSLSGRPIFTNKEGLFEERLLLSPGLNIIEIRAKDRFKKEASKTLKVYYKSVATSSPAI